MSYDNFARTFSKSRKNHPWPEIDFFLKDFKDQHYKTILDIGCGNGRLLEEIQKSEISIENYLWLDSSLGMITEARNIHPDNDFAVCDMSHLPQCNFWEKLFDAILFLASFHHLESKAERLQVLQDTKNFLSPNGRLYLTNWNLREQPRYEKSHRGDGDFDIKIGEFSRYYHGFTVAELENLFEATHYTIIENRIFEWGRNIVSILEAKK